MICGRCYLTLELVPKLVGDARVCDRNDVAAHADALCTGAGGDARIAQGLLRGQHIVWS